MRAMASIPRENIIWLPEEDRATLKVLYKPAWDKWAEDTEKFGYPAREILKDTIELVEGYSLN
jgi:hypothetical protein